MAIAAGADGNGRDRALFPWRDRVLAEAAKRGYEIHSDVALGLNGGG